MRVTRPSNLIVEFTDFDHRQFIEILDEYDEMLVNRLKIMAGDTIPTNLILVRELLSKIRIN